eukprot:6432742-Prymnesium_polylepis.1
MGSTCLVTRVTCRAPASARTVFFLWVRPSGLPTVSTLSLKNDEDVTAITQAGVEGGVRSCESCVRVTVCLLGIECYAYYSVTSGSRAAPSPSSLQGCAFTRDKPAWHRTPPVHTCVAAVARGNARPFRGTMKPSFLQPGPWPNGCSDEATHGSYG